MASVCYGGLAHARLLRALLALRSACVERGIPLRLDLGGGEALISRARAGMMARFLASDATHLIFADSEGLFSTDRIFALLEAGDGIEAAEALFLIRREAAQAVAAAYPGLQASLSDVQGAGIRGAAMVFEAMIDPATGGYLADLDAFAARYRRLSPSD